jgi:hypothetical protein
MNFPEKVQINGSVSWNDGKRLITLKKELKMFLPALNERSKDFAYDMELYFNTEALSERIRDAINNNEHPILVFLKEK